MVLVSKRTLTPHSCRLEEVATRLIRSGLENTVSRCPGNTGIIGIQQQLLCTASTEDCHAQDGGRRAKRKADATDVASEDDIVGLVKSRRRVAHEDRAPTPHRTGKLACALHGGRCCMTGLLEINFASCSCFPGLSYKFVFGCIPVVLSKV